MKHSQKNTWMLPSLGQSQPWGGSEQSPGHPGHPNICIKGEATEISYRMEVSLPTGGLLQLCSDPRPGWPHLSQLSSHQRCLQRHPGACTHGLSWPRIPRGSVYPVLTTPTASLLGTRNRNQKLVLAGPAGTEGHHVSVSPQEAQSTRRKRGFISNLVTGKAS